MKGLDNKGNVAILLCLVITALFGFAALGIDVGLVYAERAKLFNALDASALAASLELPNGDDSAKAVAVDYLQKNNVNPNNAIITIGLDHKSIEIQSSKNVQHLFAPVIGINNSNITAKSKAIIGPIKSVSGVRPFAVQMFNYTYGSRVVLKEGAGDSYQGNFYSVALGGTGASNYQNNALYGYRGTLAVGDYISTETGNMAGAASAIKNYINSESSSFSNFSRDSIRLWIIPLVNTMMVNGRSKILVLGFGEFYVEDVTSKSGKIELTGRFIRFVSNGTIDTSLEEKGLYGTKLSK